MTRVVPTTRVFAYRQFDPAKLADIMHGRRALSAVRVR